MSGSYAADGSWNATIVNAAGSPIPITTPNPIEVAPFMPQGATPIIEGGFIANATLVVSLAAIAGRTAYLSALILQSAANVAPAGPFAVAANLNGLNGATGFLWSIGSNGQGMTSEFIFNPPMPATGPNVAISLTIPNSGNAGFFVGATLIGFYI